MHVRRITFDTLSISGSGIGTFHVLTHIFVDDYIYPSTITELWLYLSHITPNSSLSSFLLKPFEVPLKFIRKFVPNLNLYVSNTPSSLLPRRSFFLLFIKISLIFLFYFIQNKPVNTHLHISSVIGIYIYTFKRK